MTKILTRKQMWNHRGAKLVCSKELAYKFSGTTTCPHKSNRLMNRTTYSFQEEGPAKQTKLHAGHLIQMETTVHSLLLSITNSKKRVRNALLQSKEEDFTTRISPSSLHPVSFKQETINGNTPMILTTMLRR